MVGGRVGHQARWVSETCRERVDVGEGRWNVDGQRSYSERQECFSLSPAAPSEPLGRGTPLLRGGEWFCLKHHAWNILY